MVTRMTSFRADNLVLITYKGFSSGENNSIQNNTFQLILAYTAAKTYGILSYDRLDTQDALVGWSAPGCSWKILETPSNSISMMSSSNMGEMGKHMFVLHSNEIKCKPFKGLVTKFFLSCLFNSRLAHFCILKESRWLVGYNAGGLVWDSERNISFKIQ